MHTMRMPLLLVCLVIAITVEVFGGQEEVLLRCNPADPICQKFKHMLRQQKQSRYNSGLDTEENLLCDQKDPICQQFQQMLNEQTDEVDSANARTRENEDRSQTSLEQENRGGTSSGQGQGTQKPSTCIPYICMLVGKTCWANGECGDFVAEERQGQRSV